MDQDGGIGYAAEHGLIASFKIGNPVGLSGVLHRASKSHMEAENAAVVQVVRCPSRHCSVVENKEYKLRSIDAIRRDVALQKGVENIGIDDAQGSRGIHRAWVCAAYSGNAEHGCWGAGRCLVEGNGERSPNASAQKRVMRRSHGCCELCALKGIDVLRIAFTHAIEHDR